MIDVDDDRERSRGREEPRGEDPPREEFKVFVGGISWQLDDYKLKEGGMRTCGHARALTCGAHQA